MTASSFDISELFALRNRGIKLSLQPTIDFLERAGNPHKGLQYFHIAGSVGKGSTAAFLASILTRAGYKTGLYTSPHFVEFNERIRINGIPVDDSFIASFWLEHKEYILNSGLTFFEVTTVMAFAYFNMQKADYVVLETGLGGRLDSTNVVTPLASVITQISLEHTNILGSTLSEIAAEKGGIIKEGVPCFIGDLPEEAESVLERMAGEKNTNIKKIKRFVAIYPEKYDFNKDDLIISGIVPPLKGKHQFLNSALAVLTVSEVLPGLNAGIIQEGIESVVSNTGISGRFEIISESPIIILDSAHNTSGIESFVQEIKRYNTQNKKLTVIFSALADKNIAEMMAKLKELTDTLRILPLQFERGTTTAELSGAAKAAGMNAIAYESVEEFFSKAETEFNKENIIAFTGSMYLIGAVKSYLANQKQIFI